LRTARRSAGGFGNSSDGGCGGPIVAHAVNKAGAAKTKIVEAEHLMRKKPDYQTCILPLRSDPEDCHPERSELE
jgi:hypothetical protein